MSRRSAALIVLALCIETMGVTGRMSRLPEPRVGHPSTDLVAAERPKNRPA